MRAAPAGAIEILEHEDPGALADVHAGAAAIERAAGRRIHQLQLVESAERQPGQRVGAAGQHGVGPARPIASAARPIAIVLDEQAATTQARGPSKPKRSAMTSTGVLRK